MPIPAWLGTWGNTSFVPVLYWSQYQVYILYTSIYQPKIRLGPRGFFFFGSRILTTWWPGKKGLGIVQRIFWKKRPKVVTFQGRKNLEVTIFKSIGSFIYPQSIAEFEKENLILCVISSQIWLIPLVDHLSTYFTKLKKKPGPESFTQCQYQHAMQKRS
jgi:hypothetical protein